MSISRVGSSDSNWEAIRGRLQSFRSGQSNITKDELKKIKDEFGNQNPASKLYDNYDKVDLNGDGVSFAELTNYAKTNKASLMGGEALTKDQLTQMRSQVSSSDPTKASALDKLIQNFSSADSNQDGSISFAEMQSYGKANGLPPPPEGPPPGDGARGGAHGPRDMSKDDLVAMRDKIASTDSTAASNLDKLISNFESTDANGDGKISGEEFKKFADANGISMPHHHSKDRRSAGANTATDGRGGESQSGDANADSTSVSAAMLRTILQRYSRVGMDSTSLLSGLKA